MSIRVTVTPRCVTNCLHLVQILEHLKSSACHDRKHNGDYYSHKIIAIDYNDDNVEKN